jgi:antitoxin (DNA-binding transcriptional repressor) of toxin-antitoxin stability system
MDVQRRLQEMVSQISSGVELILTVKMKPVARLEPVSERVAGLHAGAIWSSPDFDEPLPDALWTGNA